MPLFQRHKEKDNCLWAVWKVEETITQLLALLPHSETYQRDITRFASPKRQLEWLTVRVLLYVLLGEEKSIQYRIDGKPYFSDHSYSLSISHTRGYVAVIVGQPDKEVGIDIEQYGERVHKVASRFMRPEETLFKGLNAEEVDFCEHLQIFPFPIEESGIFQAIEYRTPNRQSFKIHYYLSPDFVLTLIF